MPDPKKKTDPEMLKHILITTIELVDSMKTEKVASLVDESTAYLREGIKAVDRMSIEIGAGIRMRKAMDEFIKLDPNLTTAWTLFLMAKQYESEGLKNESRNGNGQSQ